jgi:O-antigen/teichoic acid export membrane protein
MNGQEHQVSDGIGSRIRSGLAWKAASQITVQISRIVVALLLARLLAPHDWGVAAMVLVFSGFVVVFTDNALKTALIQRRDLLEEDRSTVFWSSAGVGLLLALGGIAISGPLASFYGEPTVQPLFIALSIGFFVTSLGTTQSALLARDMEFRRLELRQITATLIGAVAGVSIALADFGAWAIVGQQLAETATSTVLLWFVTPWRPSLTFSPASLRRLGGFAGYVFGENVLYQAGRNLSSVAIGRLLGAAALGTYTLATNVILMPFARIAGPLQQVFFPAFSLMRDDRERMADVWIRASRLVALISMPALVGLTIVAPDFVDVVLGPRWSNATIVIQTLAIVGLLQAIQTLNGEVLLALNRAKVFFWFTMLWFAGSLAAVLIGQHWGINGVAVASTIAALAIEPVRAIITTRALGIPLSRFVRSFGGVAQATGLMALAVLAARAALTASDVPVAGRLVLMILVGAAVYVAGCLWRAPEVMDEIRRALGRGRSGRETPSGDARPSVLADRLVRRAKTLAQRP